MKKQVKTLFVASIISLLTAGEFLKSVYGLELGSERFQSFTKGAPDYGILVDMGKNPKFANNLFFTDAKFVNAIAQTQFPNGSGQKYVAANAMNFQGNYVMAAAKTDPRSSAFIINSMDKLLTDQNAEIELAKGLQASKLSVAQAGENAARYLEPEIITPNVGYYQTADNEESFESAYDNVLLGRAEEALFKGDESSALSYFNQKKAEFKESENKQIEATNYQKDGLMRSKKTAETFRDFFQMKAVVSRQNLDKIPTQDSLLGNCKNNTPENENLYGAYFKAIPREERTFYQFPRPSYSFDFCEQYVHDEAHYLIKNQPVRSQLENLIADSDQMANGLDSIARDLDNKSLSVEEIAEILAQNTAWKKLSLRAEAYKECEKSNCLEAAEKTLGSMVDYPGAQAHRSPARVQLRQDIRAIASQGSMPGRLSRLAASDSSFGSSLEFKDKTKEEKRGSKGVNNNDDGDGLLSDENQTTGRSRSVATQGISKKGYKGRKYPRGGGYYRGEDGVLRGPSGKPVRGYYNPSRLDLFEVISRRYLLKLSNDEL